MSRILGWVLGWVFGVGFFLAGLGFLLQGGFLSSIASLVIALILLPPILNPRLTRVWLGANDPKDRLPFGGQVFFVVCLLVVVVVFAPQTKEEPSEQTDSIPEQADSISPLQTQEVEDQWQVHEFKIFDNTDFGFYGRSRQRIHVLAPTATTREDRIATLVDAVAEFYRKDYPDFISAMLFGGSFESESGGYNPIAMIDYVPDGCGLSGDDCTGEIWVDARASDVTYTAEQVAIEQAWKTHREDFLDTNGMLQEGRLTEFLAQEFNTTSDHIKLSFVILEDMKLPDELKGEIVLTEEELVKKEKVICRRDLQCWGDQHSIAASIYCPEHIERLGNYAHKWTDGLLGAKFSSFRWKDMDTGIVTYLGDRIQFQNGFSAWQPHSYSCDYDTLNQTVLEVRANPGRL